MRPRRCLVLSIAAAALLPAGASAAQPWSAPQDLSAAHRFVDAPAVTFGGRGDALASWRWTDGAGATASAGASVASRSSGGSAFAPERTAPATLAAPPAPYATSRVVAVTRSIGSAGSETDRLSAVFGDTAGAFGTPRTIVTRPGIGVPQIAADTAGDAAIAWFENRGVFNDRVYVSLRKPGGRFATPILLATERIRSVSVAVSPRGDVLVAWDARGTVRTRIRYARNHGFHSAQTIASEPTFFASLHTAMSARGRAYVAWTAQLLTEGGSTGPFYAEAAVRTVGAARFRSAQLLEKSQTSQAGADLAVDGETAVFAWAGTFASHPRVRVASTDARARFGALQDVSAPDANATEPAVAARDGRRVLAWTQSPGDSGGRILAAVAPAGQPFRMPEEVSAGPEARVPDVSLSPSGAPTAVWSNRPAGSSVPVASIATLAQAASRPAP